MYISQQHNSEAHSTEKWVDLFKNEIDIKEVKGKLIINKFPFSYDRKYRQLHLKIENYTPPGGKIVELGIGKGLMSIILVKQGYKVVGVDSDPQVLKFVNRLQRLFNIEFPLIQADMTSLPFQDKSIDTIFSQGLLEHHSDQKIIKSLNEQARVSKTVIFDVPTEKHAKVYGDERKLNWRQWQELVSKSNLRIIKRYGSGGFKPSFFHYLLPYGLFKLIEYRFTPCLGYICKEK